ncbi:universal stress protein [Echinicola marina]|uniref:universal stress protein n=1 Tax=Echinicola marina TaxID=2859768 RepID=UPI001CF69EE0|nr:universal stress protein [Echinicola marina]UCS94238.1 universal stress protein [Echinicola marina]
MKNIKNIAVCLDLTEMDGVLLTYLKKLHDLIPFQHLSILHLMELEELPDDISALIPKLGKSLDQIIESELIESTQEHFHIENGPQINCHIHSNPDVEDFSDYIDRQDYSLIIYGKKTSYIGSGILSAKLVRLSHCNTLFVPEIGQPIFENVTIAIDFSTYSDKIIPIAKKFQEIAHSNIHPVSILKIGRQYFPYIKNYQQISADMEAEALSKYKKLQKKHGFSTALSIIKDNEQNIGKLIYNFAVQTSSSLIIVGNKGRNDEGDLLIGSVTEQLISHEKNLPVLIVKK